ncbi:MAG: pilus assembly protein TadG-related protein [Nitriliruptorales bacterium]|nr:pilus assembly protein TadG-related protein [Nitriliruptorales bacterium]
MSVALRSQRDGGSISILAVGAIVAVIAAATLAVDLGRVAWSSRDQQGATDRAALDALRAITDLWNVETANWSVSSGWDAQARAENLAASSLAENTGAEGRATDARVSEVYLGVWDPDANEFCVWHGNISNSPGNCHDEFPSAVFVQTTSNVESLFIGSAMTSGTNQVVKEAIAVVENNVSLKVGSSVVTIDSDEATIMNELWSDQSDPAPNVGSVSLAVADYNGLIGANLALGELFTELGITAGTPSAVLDSSTFTIANVFTASANALTNQGDAASLTAATIMTQLAADVDSSLTVTIGDIINVTSGRVGSVADLSFNMFDLVRGTLVAGNGSSFADVDGLEAVLPGVTSAGFDLEVIEPEQFAAGPARWNPAANDWFTWAETSQLDFDFQATLNPTVYQAYDPLVISLPLHVDGGQARAAATNAWCLNDGTTRGAQSETTTAAATAWIGGANPGDWGTVATLRYTPLIGPTLNIAQVQIRVTEAAAPSTFIGVHDPLPETVSGGGTTIDIAGMLDPGNYQVQVVLLPDAALDPLGLLNPATLASDVVAALRPVLAAVDTNVVQPVANLTGLHLGAADTTLDKDGECGGGRILVK